MSELKAKAEWEWYAWNVQRLRVDSGYLYLHQEAVTPTQVTTQMVFVPDAK